MLDEGHLHTPFSLAEGRVLFELAHRETPTATEIAGELGLDAGYLSRLLQRLQRRRLIARTRSAHDGRHSHISLTADGKKAFRTLDRLASADVERMLDTLDDADQRRLLDAMSTIGRLLGDPDAAADRRARLHPPPAARRRLRLDHPEPRRAVRARVRLERALRSARRDASWRTTSRSSSRRTSAAGSPSGDGENVGCVFVQKDREREGVAKLRMLLVHPSTRGLGIGRRLVDECTRFARDAGYHTISLWTHSALTAARKIYADVGLHDDP